MSTYNDYEGLDRYFYPVLITQENNTLIVGEGVTDYTVTIPPGVYWSHLDSVVDSTYPSLQLEVVNQINNSGVSATYGVGVLDLSDGDLRYSSLIWKQTSGSSVGGWGFKFSNRNNTFNSGYLGFQRELTTSNRSAGRDLNGEASLLGQWIAPVKAAYKLRDSSKKAFRSDQGPNASINSWTPPKEVRGFKYHKVHGAHVYRYRAKDSTEATEAGLPTGDTNNALEDMVKSMPDSRILAKHVSSQQSDAMEFNTESPPVSESYIAMSDEVKLTEIRGERTKWEGEHYDIEGGLIIYEDESALDGYQH